MRPDIKLTIRDNVRRLLNLQDDAAGVKRLIDLGFPNGTAQRILGGTTSIGVDQLDLLADRLKVEPWQLCLPGLDPDRRPTLEPASFRWPFRRIDPDVITGLTGMAASQIENGLLASLATIGLSPSKPGSKAA
jgi:hypothetical protein